MIDRLLLLAQLLIKGTQVEVVGGTEFWLDGFSPKERIRGQEKKTYRSKCLRASSYEEDGGVP